MKSRSRIYHLQAGFTLLEMIVVLALIGLLSGMATQLFRSPAERLRLESAIRPFCATLRAARARAIASNVETIIFVDVVNKRYSSPQVSNGRFPNEVMIQIDSAQTRYLGENNGTIVFFPDGSSTGGNIILKLQQANAMISVNWLTGGATCVFS